MFKTLHSALYNLRPFEIVIAQDISQSGQKCFLRGRLDKLESVYDKLEHKHWYECLVETRPSRIFLDVESTSEVDINAIVEQCREAIRLKFNLEADMRVLDSCSSTKYSWHVLCTNLYLKNVFHVGAFVRRLILSMKNHPDRHAIDSAVYTKNRMFRVKGSSKFGSQRILTHPTDKWSDLLVQTGDALFLECEEIDGSSPSSTSMHPDKMFHFSGNKWIRSGYQSRALHANVCTTCPMLNPVLDWLDRHVSAQTCRHNLSFTHNGHYFVSARSKKCIIAKREHKGNNIWFDIDVNRQIVYQRCYDEDCRSRALPVAVPTEQWSSWNRTWHEPIHTPRNENTLFNMSP